MPLWKVCLKKSPGAAHAEARVGPLPVPRAKRVKHACMIVKRGGRPTGSVMCINRIRGNIRPPCVS